MADSTLEIKVAISYAWWLAPYLNTLLILKRNFGFEPDMEKVLAVIKRGVKAEVIHG